MLKDKKNPSQNKPSMTAYKVYAQRQIKPLRLYALKNSKPLRSICGPNPDLNLVSYRFIRRLVPLPICFTFPCSLYLGRERTAACHVTQKSTVPTHKLLINK